eukprot:scaffold112125_cov18-Tisochrysis_lutea.AAC.1
MGASFSAYRGTWFGEKRGDRFNHGPRSQKRLQGKMRKSCRCAWLWHARIANCLKGVDRARACTHVLASTQEAGSEVLVLPPSLMLASKRRCQVGAWYGKERGSPCVMPGMEGKGKGYVAVLI